jgi:hypothetical protein
VSAVMLIGGVERGFARSRAGRGSSFFIYSMGMAPCCESCLDDPRWISIYSSTDPLKKGKDKMNI